MYLSWKNVTLSDGSKQKMEIWKVGDVQYGRTRKMRERYKYTYIWYQNLGNAWEKTEETDEPYYRPIDVEGDADAING